MKRSVKSSRTETIGNGGQFHASRPRVVGRPPASALGLRASFARHEVSRERFLRVEFETAVGTLETMVIPAIQALNPTKLLQRVKAQGAMFPADGATRAAMQDLLDQAAHDELVLTTRPGFRGLGGFVMPECMLGGCARRYQWNQVPSDPSIGEAGRKHAALHVWMNGTGRLALHSSYVSLGILLALAAPIPTYVALRTEKNGAKQPILSESALFNFSGASGSGKTTVARAAASVIGHPDAIAKWEISRRGVEEQLAGRNDLIVVFDDTEKFVGPDSEMRHALRAVIQLLPDGRSKILSEIVAPKGLPPLRWSTMGISSSPKPFQAIAGKLGWTMTNGELVRAFDIGVPLLSEGGIFDRLERKGLSRMAESESLARQLETTLLAGYGSLFPRWLRHLVWNDSSTRLLALQDKFVITVCPHGDAWEKRFARKFGLLAAVGQVAVEARLLPWPKEWTWQVAELGYRKARQAAAAVQPNDQVPALLQFIVNHRADPTVFPANDGDGRIRLQKGALGFVLKRNGIEAYALRDEELNERAGNQFVRAAFDRFVDQHGLVLGGHGQRRTTQLRQTIIVEGREIEKPRLLLIDAARLAHAVAVRS